MCWKTRKTPIKQIAESDLKVYKILKYVENYIISPIRGFIWELNKTYKTELDNPNYYIDERRNVINCGFHSLLDSPKLHRTMFFASRIWYIKSSDIMLYSPNEYVFEAIIPKGSEYYENENGEIVSNQLKIIKQYAG